MIGFTHWLCRMQAHPPIQPVIPNNRPSVPCRCGRYYTAVVIDTEAPWEPGTLIEWHTEKHPFTRRFGRSQFNNMKG
jgi:hypothetical protein